MKRSPGIRHYKTAAGEDRYQARIRTITGDEAKRSFTLKGDAEKWRTARLRERQLGDEYQPPSPTHGEFRAEFEKRQQVGKRPATVAFDTLALGHLADLDPLKLSQVRAEKVEDLVYKLAKTSPRVAQKALELEKRLLRSARDRGHRIDEAVLRIKPPPHTPAAPVIRPYTDCETACLYLEEVLQRMPLLAYLTGMRLSELCYVEDRDLCLSGCQEEGAAHVHVRVGVGRKCKVPRVVVLSQTAATLVREQLLVRPSGAETERMPTPGAFPGAGVPKGTGEVGRTLGADMAAPGGTSPRSVSVPDREQMLARPNVEAGHVIPDARATGHGQVPRGPASALLFPRPGFPRWDKDSVGVRWRKACGLAGIGPWRFHHLKHSFCTLALSRGVNPILIARNSGHFKAGKPDPSLIWQRYGHLFGSDAAVEIGKLDTPAREEKAEEA